MEWLADTVFLSRLQFGVTAGFHILWPVLTIGLALYLVYLEALWLKSKDLAYYRHYRYWLKYFILAFGLGVASGIPLEFQFGTNWGPFSAATGGFFGHLLGVETTSAFMLEAAFLGIALFGWKRVRPAVHFFSTCMVALGTTLSAFWIMAANAWMQTPTGGIMENGRYVVTDYSRAIFNPDLFWSASHMWIASLETTAFAVGGVSAWYLLRRKNVEFFLKSFKHAVLATILLAPVQFLLGDGQGLAVAHHQPAKLAAIEAHWETNPPGVGADWNIVAWPDRENQRNAFELSIPYGLSMIITKSLTGQIQGLSEFPRDEQPSVLIPFYSFRIMLGVGTLMVAVMMATVWGWRKGWLRPENIRQRPWLLYAWMALGPLGLLAVEAGWMMREVGRQPWAIYGLLRTRDAASALPPGTVLASITVFSLIYALLLVFFLWFARRILREGPDLDGSPPQRSGGLN